MDSIITFAFKSLFSFSPLFSPLLVSSVLFFSPLFVLSSRLSSFHSLLFSPHLFALFLTLPSSPLLFFISSALISSLLHLLPSHLPSSPLAPPSLLIPPLFPLFLFPALFTSHLCLLLALLLSSTSMVSLSSLLSSPLLSSLLFPRFPSQGLVHTNPAVVCMQM